MKIAKIKFLGMSLNDLATACIRIVANAEQDLDFLSKLGVTAELLASLKAKAVAILAAPNHQYYLGEKSGFTEKRNSTAEKLKQMVKELRSQTLFVSSFSIGEHQVAFNSSLNVKVGKLIDTAALMLNILKNTTEDLSLYAVTPERIAEFEALINELVHDKANQEGKTVGLNDYTEDRMLDRAELTNLLIFVSTVGKAYWGNKSKSKKDNYVVTKLLKASIGTEASQTGVETPESNF